MIMIKLCIFDMDGLLVDTESAMWMKNGQTVLKKMGFEFNDQFYRSLMGSNIDYAANLLDDYYGPTFSSKEYFRQVLELNREQIKRHDLPIMKGAIELLTYLKENNIQTAIGTSTHRDLAYDMIDAIGIKDYIDKIVCGDEVQRSKPNPDIYLKVIEQFPDIKKDEAFVFEDAHSGIRAAIKAGIPVIGVPNVAFITDEDKKEAYRIINSLDEAIDIIKEINK